MAKKKKAAPRRRSSSRRGSAGITGNLMQAAYLALGYVAARKVGDMLQPMLPDPTMRNGVLAVGGAMLMPMLPAGFSPVGLGMAASGVLGAVAGAFPQLGISGPDGGGVGALSDMDVDELEAAILEASSMRGLDDRNDVLTGIEENYSEGVMGMDDRNAVLTGNDMPDDDGDDDEG